VKRREGRDHGEDKGGRPSSPVPKAVVGNFRKGSRKKDPPFKRVSNLRVRRAVDDSINPKTARRAECETLKSIYNNLILRTADRTNAIQNKEAEP